MSQSVCLLLTVYCSLSISAWLSSAYLSASLAHCSHLYIYPGGGAGCVAYSVILICMTLNGLDWLFHVKFCFRVGLAGWDCATSKIIAWKLVKIDTYSQWCKSLAGTLVSRDIRFVRIFARVLEKEDVKGQWGQALMLVLNIFSWLSKTAVWK